MARPVDIIILPNAEAVVREAAGRIAHLVETAHQAKKPFHLVLSGGATPKRLYEILAKRTMQSDVAWDHVHFYWGDERCVGPEHSDSNYKMAYDALLSKINIPASHIHRMQGEGDPEQSAQDYETILRGVPLFDLVLLGMGADGHTASLFPETQALKERTKWVVANFVPKLEAVRLTLTPVILNQATNILFLVAGGDKAKTVKAVLDGPYNPDLLPAQLIRKETGKVTWIIDEAASACCSSAIKE